MKEWQIEQSGEVLWFGKQSTDSNLKCLCGLVEANPLSWLSDTGDVCFLSSEGASFVVEYVKLWKVKHLVTLLFIYK